MIWSTIFINLVMPWALSLAGAAISAAVPVGMTWLNNHLALSRSLMLNSMVSGAVGRAGGLVQNYLDNNATLNPKIDTKSIAMNLGIDYVLRSFPAAVSELKVSKEHIAEMITAEIGKSTAKFNPISVAMLG
jgi:hypothetical protein